MKNKKEVVVSDNKNRLNKELTIEDKLKIRGGDGTTRIPPDKD